MSVNDIEDAWYDSETEWTRFSICEQCKSIHSRTYEGCGDESEFNRFYKQPKTVWNA